MLEKKQKRTLHALKEDENTLRPQLGVWCVKALSDYTADLHCRVGGSGGTAGDAPLWMYYTRPTVTCTRPIVVYIRLTVRSTDAVQLRVHTPYSDVHTRLIMTSTHLTVTLHTPYSDVHTCPTVTPTHALQ